MRVEIVATFQVCRYEKDEFGIGVIRTGAVITIPDRITKTRAGGTDIGMAVVPIDVPCLQHPIHISFMTRPPYMVCNFIIAALLQRLAYTSCNVVQHFIPGHPFPVARSAFALPLERIEDTIRIRDLVDGSRAFGTVATTAARVVRIALKLAHRIGLLVYKGRQSASAFTVEAGRRNDGIMFFHLARMVLCLIFHPVIPFFGGRETGQIRRLGHVGQIPVPVFVQIGNDANAFGKTLYKSWFLCHVSRRLT